MLYHDCNRLLPPVTVPHILQVSEGDQVSDTEEPGAHTPMLKAETEVIIGLSVACMTSN